MLKPHYTKKFKKDYKLSQRQNKDIKLFQQILTLLSQRKPLHAKHENHPLQGKFKGKWECHINPDWLFVYEITETHIICWRLASHSDLFK